MFTSLFGNGYRGLSDSLFSGVKGSVFKSVGIDSRSEPGVIKAHQKLAKDSGATIDELCKAGVSVSDGSRVWFSSESGKIWREVGGVYSLLGELTLEQNDVRTLYKKGSTSLSVQLGFKNALFRVSPAGGKILACALNGNDIYEYYLKENSDISTASFTGNSYSSPQTSNISTLEMGNSGKKVYVVQFSQSIIYEYDLPSVWSLASTPTYSGKSLDVSARGVIVNGMQFNSDGTRMFILTDDLYQYDLSTPWDISTAVYNSVFYGFPELPNVYGFRFTSDGKNIYANGTGSFIYQYSLSTPWDISTVSYTNKNFDAFPDTDYVNDFFWNFDIDGNNNLYAAKSYDSNNDINSAVIYQYGIMGSSLGEVKALSAEELNNEIYWTIENYVLKVKKEDVIDITSKFNVVGKFENGSTEHHPMVKQNTALYIGDENAVSQVGNDKLFSTKTFLNLPEGEKVQCLSPFDVDILIGTKTYSGGRVLRWDGLSESWSAQDDIYEKGGVMAFIRDDNYVYPVGGTKGSIYYYNGAKCKDFLTIPGVKGLDEIKVNEQATAFYLGTPLVGVSNGSADPVLEGIYGYGSYNSNYAKSLSLDFPISNTQMSGMEIGKMLVDGTDLYVAWKDATDQGISKIDWNNKYDGAFFETKSLTPSLIRHQLKTLSDVLLTYKNIPTNTGVSVGVKKAYEPTFTDMDMIDESLRKLIKLKNPSVPNIADLQLKITLNTNNNDSPEILDTLYKLTPFGEK